ncbi:MAG: S-methyl-5'-thioadenosine phosphorylase, partial [Rhodospirillales bacterium]|nr:S-methyl-5'-thioadenosine phosphorylase [Rhodospirillales bacterium]
MTEPGTPPVIGIIGGSGIYDIEGLEGAEWKRAGASEVVSLSACGSLKEELPPGTFVLVEQFIDRTFAREKSFFGEGLVAHVGLGDPVCARLARALEAAARAHAIPTVRGGTYLVMEGPQFSTKAES